MLDVYKFTFPGQPFPREHVGHFKTPFTLMDKFGFTKKEMTAGLNGETVRDRFVFEWAPKFLREVAIDEIIKEYGDFVPKNEIVDLLNISENAFFLHVSRALHRLQRQGVDKKLAQKIARVKELQRRRQDYGECEIISTTEIVVEEGE